MILYSGSIFLGYLFLLINDKRKVEVKNYFIISSLTLIIVFCIYSSYQQIKIK